MQPNDPNKTDALNESNDSLKNREEAMPGAPILPNTDNPEGVVSSRGAEQKDTVDTPASYDGSPHALMTDAPAEPEASSSYDSVSASEPASVAAPASVVTPVVPRKKSKKIKLFTVLAVVVLLLGGASAGAYFGLYTPNKPENIWKSAMANSGKVYDEAVTYATKDREQKVMKIEGSYDLDGAVESDGKVTGEWQGLNGKLNGEISAAGLKVGFDTRTIKATDDSSDLYFKLTGLQGLGSLLGGSGSDMAAALNGLNDQWFVIDHTLIEQAASANDGANYTQEDIKMLLEKAGGPTKEYLLSADQQKAVFVVKQQVGFEQKEGRNTYHYKVGYNNENLGRYVEALCNAIKDDKIGKLILENEKKSCKDLGADAAKQKTDETADVWVDKRTKLPHVVRVTDKKNSENWVEFGQDYQGGDKFPMSLKVRSKEKDQNIEVDLKSVVNLKTDDALVDGTFAVKSGADKDVTGKMSLKLIPSGESSIKVEKPDNAKSIIELLNSLGLGGLLGGLSQGAGSTAPSQLETEDLPRSVQ